MENLVQYAEIAIFTEVFTNIIMYIINTKKDLIA